jgi:hypothetical protein
MTLDAIAARSRLIAEPKLHRLAAEPVRQPIQCHWRVRDPPVLSDLAAQPALGYGHDNPVLVNV